MFTGLIADVGEVTSVEAGDGGARLRVATELAAELQPGDSVAIAGACLTAATLSDGSFEADVVNQTLAHTTLGGLEPGSPVNVELPLRAADRLGGHLVQGHVDGVGEVAGLEADGVGRRIRVRPPDDLLALIAPRGSIAIDGVSLTVADAGRDDFEIALIPETLQRTTLGAMEPGGRVNLECDVLARYVRRALSESVPATSSASRPGAAGSERG